ncbi:MAG: HAMP domain-containing histidine kinase [Candidatus Sungbacteria bacterium]|nr:HAMP domain-containing histidine kinase [Candidatus Sungbacteria bacterium]
MNHSATHFNFIGECKELKLGLWTCPPFLFILMGFFTIVSMIATYVLASRYIDEPQIAALVVILIAVVFLIIGNIIVSSFRRIAEAHKMQSEFISIVSHQLRSPLSIIKWSAEAATREQAQGNPLKQQEFFETTQQTVSYMIRLVNSLLEVSRIEAETFFIKEEVFSFKELMQEIMSEFIDYAHAANIELTLTAAETLPEIAGDRERTEMVVQNLIDNAIRYSRRAGTTDISITPVSSSYVRFEVRDHGVGIPKEQQQKVFSKFFRATNGKKVQTGGTGIGLYIAKRFIEAMGGEIGFTSEIDKGTTFWFTLPIAKS